MAKNEVTITLKLIQEGDKIKVVAKDTEKLADNTKKVDDAQNKGRKSADKFHKAQKGVAHAGMNSTKAFSKMKGELGGSSGLVGAYATLAANVFAATAAFNALRSAAQVQTLAEGFGFLAGVSGRTSEVIAGNIQRITGNAISMEDALRTAAVGIQSGFSSTQLERLTAVAKNASIALGRNLGDSVDRLVRGVAKLEPEILDELGIIVRLNTATESYAQKIGKASGDLSEFERQQAFLNATLEQGELKYGAIGDAVDANPFDKLAGSFTNLTNKMLGFISGALEPLISLFASSQMAMLGALTMFGSTIVTQMLPGLADLTSRQLENARAAHEQADAQASAGEKIAKAQRKLVKAGGDVDSPAGFANLQKRLKKGKASAKDMQSGLDSLRRSERARDAALQKYSGDELKRKTKELEEIRRLKRETEELIKVEGNRGKLTTGGVLAAGRAERADITAEGVGNIQGGGAFGGFKEAFKQNKLLRQSLKNTKVEIKGTGNTISRFGARSLASFRTAGMGAKLFGTALLNAIPVIGQIIFAVGIVVTLFKKFAGSSEEVNSSISNLNAVGDTYARKQGDLSAVQERINAQLVLAKKANDGLGDSFEIASLEAQKYANQVKFTAGVLGEFADGSAALQKSLSQDGVGMFTLMLGRLQDRLKAVGEGFKTFVKFLKDGVKSTLEFAASLKIPGAQTMLDNMNANEAAIKRGSREMEAFKRTQTNAFDQITDPKLKAAINAQFVGEGGLAGALKKAEDAVISGEKGFEAATNGIIAGLNAAKTIAQTADTSITTFGSTFQELTKQLNKGAQAEKAKNDFSVMADQFKALQKAGQDMIAGNTFEEASKQLNTLIGPDLNDQLVNLGFSFKDLVENVANPGTLAAFIKQLEDAAELSDRLKILKEENKSAVAANKAEVNAALEKLTVEQQIESIKLRGTAALNGQQEMAAADMVHTMRMANSKAEEERLLNINDLDAQNKRDQLLKNADLSKTEKETRIADINKAHEEAKKKIEEEADFTEKKLSVARAKAVDKAGTTGTTSDRLTQIGEANIFGKVSFDEEGNKTTEKGIGTAQQKIEKLQSAFSPMMEDLTKLGPEGAFMSSIASGALNVASALETIGTKGESSANKLAAVGSIVTEFGNISKAASNARIAAIDGEIAAEKKRDGKSKGSLAKIKALEGKKEQMKRKAFETDKKTKLAAAVMNTASAMMAAASPPNPPLPISAPMVAMAAALGAMQIATIAKMKYAGGGSAPSGAGVPQQITVGKRNNKVDVSQKVGSGELSYLRGAKGIGSSAANFRPSGAAGMRKGYANGGEILVGERGPEVIEPRNGGYEVVPNDKMSGNTTNANFTINAVDAAGVAEVLTQQRGNIIGMIREAAHEHGEEFIEAVNTGSYGGDG